MRRLMLWSLILALFVLPVLTGCESQKLKDENTKLKQQVETITKDLDDKKAKMDELTKNSGELKQRIDELTAKNEELSKKLAALEKKTPAKKPAAKKSKNK